MSLKNPQPDSELRYTLPIPRSLEELNLQLDELHTFSERVELLDILERELRDKLHEIEGNPFENDGFSDESSQAIIDSWRKIQSAIPNARQHLNQEFEGNSKGFEFNEWRKGRQSPYPLVWNEGKFREYERMIHEAGQLEDWVRWLLRGLSKGTIDPNTDDSLEFSRNVLNPATIDADNKGEDRRDIQWECINVPLSFKNFLEEQRDNLPQHSSDEKLKKIKVIPEDAVLKIRVIIGLSKLKNIFSDLERQGFVMEGTTLELEKHFTESLEKDPVPSNANVIKWEGTLYELRSFVRSLRSNECIEGQIKMISKHFSFNGRIIEEKQLKKGPNYSENLDSLSSILARHDINCVP